MTNIANLLNKLFVIIFISVVIIAAIYVWVLPIFLHGYKTYSFLAIGAIGPAALGGYYCYKAASLMPPVARYVVSSFSGVMVAVLVVLFSLFIILNVRGT